MPYLCLSYRLDRMDPNVVRGPGVTIAYKRSLFGVSYTDRKPVKDTSTVNDNLPVPPNVKAGLTPISNGKRVFMLP